MLIWVHACCRHGIDQRVWCVDGCCANQAAISGWDRPNAKEPDDRKKKTKVTTDVWHGQATERKAMPKQVQHVPFPSGNRGLLIKRGVVLTVTWRGTPHDIVLS